MTPMAPTVLPSTVTGRSTKLESGSGESVSSPPMKTFAFSGSASDSSAANFYRSPISSRTPFAFVTLLNSG